MSVVVTIHFPVSDVAKAVEGLHSNAQFLEEILASTKNAGLIHHRFVSGDGELVVIDEWDSAEQFQSFFDGNPKVAQVMSSIGMTGDPEISMFGSIDAPGSL
jgi:heme-degrading monooxygenase HmoA